MEESFLAYFGHFNIDVSIRVPFLPKVGSVGVEDVKENFGGTAGNFAMISGKLGYDFDSYGAVSKKTHESYLNYLNSIGVTTDHIDVLEEGYGPICYISSDGNDQVAYMFQGPMDRWDPSLTYPKGKKYNWVHFSTGHPEPYIRLFPEILGSKIGFDPGQEIHYNYSAETTAKFLERCDLLICNEAELAKIGELTGSSREKIASAAATIVMTRGSKGVTIFSGGRAEEVPALPAENVYETIGAGDSFRAGLYYGLSRDLTFREAVAMGIVVSSTAIQGPMTDFTLSGKEAEQIMHDNSRLFGL